MSVKIAVVLHGCGAQDGTEIHEAVCTMLGFQQLGAKLTFFAPAGAQKRVVNHLTGAVTVESRSMIEESARIARGQVTPWTECRAKDFDAVVIPGGTGTAFNLCNFAEAGAKMQVDPYLQDLLRDFNQQRKPIGAICIAPVILARVFGELGVSLTIGNDAKVAAKMQEMGARHIDCPVDDCVVDTRHRLVTTPAYMLAENAAEVFKGVSRLCVETLKLCDSHE